MFSKVILQCQMVSWPTGQNLKEKNCYWIGFQKLSVASDPRIDYMLPYPIETFGMSHCALVCGLMVGDLFKGDSSEIPTQGFPKRNTLREGGKDAALFCWFHPCCEYKMWLNTSCMTPACEASLQIVHCLVRDYPQIQHLSEECQPLAVWNVHFLCSKQTVYLIFTSSLLEICAAGQTSPPVSSMFCECFIMRVGVRNISWAFSQHSQQTRSHSVL